MSAHSYNKIWLHLIWGTHKHEKVIPASTRPQIANKLLDIAKEKEIIIRALHVHSNHVHTLIELPTNLSVEQVSKHLKGVLSHWINSEKILKQHFQWGKGYAVFSVSESVVDKVVHYIQNQDEHHRMKTFREEVQAFLAAYNIEHAEDSFLE